MARRKQERRGRSGPPQDLEPYLGCRADAQIGLEPLAVGWLQRGGPFLTGRVPAGFTEKLAEFCEEPHTVCARPGVLPCPLCGERPVGNMTAEIRVIGEMDIYAAPVQILHYVTAHEYRPPDVFIEAVLQGPAAGSPEHRALVRTLRMS